MTITQINEPQCKHAVERWRFNRITRNVVYWVECDVDGKHCIMFDCEMFDGVANKIY